MPYTPRGIWYPDGTVRASAIQSMRQLAESVDATQAESARAVRATVERAAGAGNVQNFTNGQVQLASFPLVVEDEWGMYNASDPTKLTVPVAGVYIVSWWSSFAAHATGVRLSYLRQNSTIVAQSYFGPTNGTSLAAGQFAEYRVAQAGDFFQVSQYHTAGVTLATGAQPVPRLSVVRVGDA